MPIRSQPCRHVHVCNSCFLFPTLRVFAQRPPVKLNYWLQWLEWSWDYVIWLEYGASNSKGLDLISPWAIHLGAGLDPCGSFTTQNVFWFCEFLCYSSGVLLLMHDLSPGPWNLSLALATAGFGMSWGSAPLVTLVWSPLDQLGKSVTEDNSDRWTPSAPQRAGSKWVPWSKQPNPGSGTSPVAICWSVRFNCSSQTHFPLIGRIGGKPTCVLASLAAALRAL